MANKRGPKSMTDNHKAAIAEGRSQNRSVKAYLVALEENRPKRGRKRSPENVKQRLEAIEAALSSADPLTKLHLIQERSDLKASQQAAAKTVDMAVLERDFVGVAKSYGDRKGISYSTWLELGVPKALLERAGITKN